MCSDIEMSPAEEDLRDAMKDDAAFDHVSTFSPPPGALWVVHDHMNADGTEQPVSALLSSTQHDTSPKEG